MRAASFRSQWRSTAAYGAIDLVLHAAAAWWLPGPWWFQWLPDAVMPLLWLRSMITDRMADHGSALLAWHRMLHVRGWDYLTIAAAFWWTLAVLAWWHLGVHGLVLPLHVTIHIVIDRMTHDEGWQ